MYRRALLFLLVVFWCLLNLASVEERARNAAVAHATPLARGGEVALHTFHVLAHAEVLGVVMYCHCFSDIQLFLLSETASRPSSPVKSHNYFHICKLLKSKISYFTD